MSPDDPCRKTIIWTTLCIGMLVPKHRAGPHRDRSLTCKVEQFYVGDPPPHGIVGLLSVVARCSILKYCQSIWAVGTLFSSKNSPWFLLKPVNAVSVWGITTIIELSEHIRTKEMCSVCYMSVSLRSAPHPRTALPDQFMKQLSQLWAAMKLRLPSLLATTGWWD